MASPLDGFEVTNRPLQSDGPLQSGKVYRQNEDGRVEAVDLPTAAAGQSVSWDQLSPGEQAILAELGVTQGTPVTQELLRQFQLDDPLADLKPPVPENTPPLKVPEPVPLESLPAEKQQEYAQKLREMTAPWPAQTTTPTQRGPAQSSSQPADQTVSPLRPEAPPSSAPAETTTPEPQTQPASIELTDEDRMLFVQHILGAPYERSVSLLKGQVVAVFRRCDIEDYMLLEQQLHIDIQSKELTTTAHYLIRAAQYRLVLHLRRLTVGGRTWEFPPIRQWGVQASEGQTILQRIAHDFLQLVSNPSLIYLLSRKVTEFTDKIAALEQEAYQENF